LFAYETARFQFQRINLPAQCLDPRLLTRLLGVRLPEDIRRVMLVIRGLTDRVKSRGENAAYSAAHHTMRHTNINRALYAAFEQFRDLTQYSAPYSRLVKCEVRSSHA
jgi:hypothetical protein